jgi:hypothetical protein
LVEKRLRNKKEIVIKKKTLGLEKRRMCGKKDIVEKTYRNSRKLTTQIKEDKKEERLLNRQLSKQ